MGLPREKIPVFEQFVSIQGEGKNLGVPYIFIRVGGCPLRCRFCDSEYTWTLDPLSIKKTSDVAKWAYEALYSRDIDWVSITGGEPMLYPEQLKDMMLFWRNKSRNNIKVHIETSGRFYDEHVHRMCDLWSMDIKTPCTNEVQESDLDHLQYMRTCDQVKCLIEDEDDLNYARLVHERLGGRCELVLQPFNMNVDRNDPGKTSVLLEQYHWLVKKILDSKVTWPNIIITPQVHVLIFGNTPAT